MKVSIGCDHAAWELKEEIKKYLLESSRIVLLCRFIDLRKNQLIFC